MKLVTLCSVNYIIAYYTDVSLPASFFGSAVASKVPKNINKINTSNHTYIAIVVRLTN